MVDTTTSPQQTTLAALPVSDGPAPAGHFDRVVQPSMVQFNDPLLRETRDALSYIDGLRRIQQGFGQRREMQVLHSTLCPVWIGPPMLPSPPLHVVTPRLPTYHTGSRKPARLVQVSQPALPELLMRGTGGAPPQPPPPRQPAGPSQQPLRPVPGYIPSTQARLPLPAELAQLHDLQPATLVTKKVASTPITAYCGRVRSQEGWQQGCMSSTASAVLQRLHFCRRCRQHTSSEAALHKATRAAVAMPSTTRRPGRCTPTSPQPRHHPTQLRLLGTGRGLRTHPISQASSRLLHRCSPLQTLAPHVHPSVIAASEVCSSKA